MKDFDEWLFENSIWLTEPGHSQAERFRRVWNAALAAQREAYNELLYAVEQKWPDETRHQTALRYIQEAESRARSDSGTKESAIRAQEGSRG